MNNYGTNDLKDKIFGALVYLLPIIYVAELGFGLMRQFPVFQVIYQPLTPLLQLIYGVPFAGLIVFFALFMGVVRNQNISRFIRFNTMQAILLDILLVLYKLLFSVLGRGFSGGLMVQTLNNAMFLGILAASFYAIAQCFQGKYAELPIVSEAASSQTYY